MYILIFANDYMIAVTQKSEELIFSYLKHFHVLIFFCLKTIKNKKYDTCESEPIQHEENTA